MRLATMDKASVFQNPGKRLFKILAKECVCVCVCVVKRYYVFALNVEGGKGWVSAEVTLVESGSCKIL